MADLSVVARRSPDSRCAYCHGTGPELDECHGCGALTHKECRATHGSCPTLGCRSLSVAREAAHREGRWSLMLRILARGLGLALVPGILVVPVLARSQDAPNLWPLWWALVAAPLVARAVYLCRRAWKLLDETPEPLLLTVKDVSDHDDVNEKLVASLSSAADRPSQVELPIRILHAPDWVLRPQVAEVLVYGARGTGPFVVGMARRWPQLALFAPLFAVKLPPSIGRAPR